MESETWEGKTENGLDDGTLSTGEEIFFLYRSTFHESSVEIFKLFSISTTRLTLFFPVFFHSDSSLSSASSSSPPPGAERGAWSLVCDTEEQWVSLAESIKDKSSPQDRHLYRIISQNFLPEISSMIEHKVRGWRVESGATALILCGSGVNNAECQLK